MVGCGQAPHALPSALPRSNVVVHAIQWKIIDVFFSVCDKTFMRRACQSCKFSEDRIPKPMPGEEDALRALFEVVGAEGKTE